MSVKEKSWLISKELECSAIELELAIRSICAKAPDTLWLQGRPATTVVEHLQHLQAELVGWYTDVLEYPKVKRTPVEKSGYVKLK